VARLALQNLQQEALVPGQFQPEFHHSNIWLWVEVAAEAVPARQQSLAISVVVEVVLVD
jgi:hypothetical protein